MFTEPEANNCFRIIFRGEYQGLQNNRLKHKIADVIVRVHSCFCSHSFNNKLTCTSIIEFGNKTNERNTMKNKSIQYLCFIVVDFLHS